MHYKPSEWQEKQYIILAWPYRADLWQKNLANAQKEFIALISAMKNEPVFILLPSQEELKKAKAKGLAIEEGKYFIVDYADIWLRDTLPIMVKNKDGKQQAVIPQFNGWGNKYLMPQDVGLNQRIAEHFKLQTIKSNLVFEGGAIEVDDQGLLITTKDCLIDQNRNPGLTQDQIQAELMKLFGCKKVIWLDASLKNDHTDGHIDTLLRFIGHQKIAIMKPSGQDDPNFKALTELKRQIEEQTDYDVASIPSPGLILDNENNIMPASYLNFIIGNNGVYMPTYGSVYDEEAQRALSKHFKIPVYGLSAKAILTGGGAFHCMSQEVFI